MKCVTLFVFCLICGASLFAQSTPTTEQKHEPPSGTSSRPGPEKPAGLSRICDLENPQTPCVSPPRIVFAPGTQYSREARDAHYEGTCVLWVTIGSDGKPHNIRVARGIGYGLDEKAVDAVEQWKFEPAMKDGKPVAVQINLEVSFRLWGVEVSPTSAQVITGSQQQFSAIVSPLSEAPSSGVNWSVSGSGCVAAACGSISSDGLYTAPRSLPNPAAIIVTATSPTDPSRKASAQVTILSSPSR